ncbi:Mu-like prophage protein gp29 [[Luteovulum] sphaeroides subsp. megalophilum]|uniref:DUF935 domain-containing protein n=1 Tax=Cereibacter sphaeroides TaxID=1063 RepID=UPI000B6E26D9|nr:DUF935 domain-containing protein [Cereibacter sphaeroides]SNS86923.1 Mu-like prophage protein gp29 [[Luteovulum] sphaeroides subsp. megalophilum]
MAKTPVLLDRWGNPVNRSRLAKENVATTLGSVRSPITGYPADGLNPVRLASILREADAGDPVRYLELAETIEERDLHYLGVLGTRRRSVSQLDITVEAASDDPEDVKKAEMVRDWLRRDELAEELFHMLDCIGKGYSFTRIVWDTSEGQWRPERLEWQDPRWFRFNRNDLSTPLMLGDHGEELPLEPFRFIFAAVQAKSGIALRSGLARAAAWAWMFKAFTQRDWAIFTQTYGQPLRLGRFGPGASEEDKATLFRAVANIAGDCAAIIPESMQIDFVETKSVGATADLYKQRADWLDQQISKAVLGQTATTDAVTGGLGSGKEHRQVQEDIERADAKAMSGILNRDLIRPWIVLEYGPQQRYPRLRIARPEAEDLQAMATALAALIPLGMRVSQKKTRDRFGFDEPENDDDILGLPRPARPATAPAADPSDRNPPIKRFSGEIKGGQPLPGPETALQAEEASAALPASADPAALLAERLATEAAPAVAGMLETVETMLAAATSLGEFREMLIAGFPELDASGLARVMANAMFAAHAGGRAAVEEESGE